MFRNQQIALIETHFISDASSYMFWHQGAIIREFINNKGL
jgi:hypothetical protein